MKWERESTPPDEIGIGKLPEQREFKGFSFVSEVLIPLAQAALAGVGAAGLVLNSWWLMVALVAGFVMALAADAITHSWAWTVGAGMVPVALLIVGCGSVAFQCFFELLYERNVREAVSPWGDRPGPPIIQTVERIRYRVVFVNGRRATVEDATPPAEEAMETLIDSRVLDLAEFAARAAGDIGLSRSRWCPTNGQRITLQSGREVSQGYWAELNEELATKYQFVRKQGNAYEWAVNPPEAVAFLKALAEGREEMPPYPI